MSDPVKFSTLPRTQKQIVAALLDGKTVIAHYDFSSGVRGGPAGGWIVVMRGEAGDRFDRYAGSAVMALDRKGIINRGNEDDPIVLLPGAVIDDRVKETP